MCCSRAQFPEEACRSALIARSHKVQLTEFELIERYFSHGPLARADVILGVGDDAAILRPASGQDVVTAIHTMTQGPQAEAIHHDPSSQGVAALAPPLSRLAAAGAEPAWASLALTVPRADPAWLQGFSQGFLGLASRFGVQLTGGDCCRGPFAATVLASGLVPSGPVAWRRGACPGDLLFVTGTPAGERQEENRIRVVTEPSRVEPPTPLVAEGIALRELATAVTDLPAGLRAALHGLLGANGVGAMLSIPRISNDAERARAGARGELGCYELCFALPPEREATLLARFAALRTRLSLIGVVEPVPGIRYQGDDATAR